MKFFFTSVNERTHCLAIQGFDRTKPIFDRTLSVDRPLFQALRSWFLSLKTREHFPGNMTFPG